MPAPERSWRTDSARSYRGAMSKHAANDAPVPEDRETTADRETTEDSIEQEFDGADEFLPVAEPTSDPAPAP